MIRIHISKKLKFSATWLPPFDKMKNNTINKLD